MQKTLLLKGFIYSIISAASFASLVIFIKLGYDSGLSTKEMLVYRFAAGSLFMFLFLFVYKRRSLKPSLKLLQKAFVTGGLLYTVQSFCFFSSVKYVAPSVTELLLYLYPAFVTFLAALVYKEKITAFKMLYIAVIIAGFLFIFKDALYSKLKITGVMFGLAAMIIYSLYLIVVQSFLKETDSFSLTFYTIVFAAVSFGVVFGIPKNLPNRNQIYIILALGFITTLVAIGFLFAAINMIGSSLASVFSSFEPIITIILSFVIFGVGMNKYQIIGAILILAGVFMANIYHLIAGENQ